MRAAIIAGILAIGVAASAADRTPNPPPKPTPIDPAKLVGTWVVTRYNGKPKPPDGSSITFSKDGVVVSRADLVDKMPRLGMYAVSSNRLSIVYDKAKAGVEEKSGEWVVTKQDIDEIEFHIDQPNDALKVTIKRVDGK